MSASACGYFGEGLDTLPVLSGSDPVLLPDVDGLSLEVDPLLGGAAHGLVPVSVDKPQAS